ncbi:MAG: MBL fold metallo-hydrolase, partial [Rhodocyclaceae bacterium]|nr:MBL fold metallo-hydrolase [Rhodocyclaceae bacterium]
MNPLEYPFPTPPAPGERCALGAGVHWLRMPLPFALNHVNLWLLEDGAAWTAVDAGIALEEVKAAWQRARADRRLSRLIVTHFHPDHLGLAAWLDAPLWIAPEEYRHAQATLEQRAGHSVAAMLDFFACHGLEAARLSELAGRGNAYARGVPALPARFQPLAEGDLLRIGEHDWRVLLSHAHSPAHVSLYCETAGLLISGDMVLPRISTNVSLFSAAQDGDPLGAFLASLERLTVLPADTLVLPSHGLPFYGLQLRSRQLELHHEQRLAALLELMDRPKTGVELARG